MGYLEQEMPAWNGIGSWQRTVGDADNVDMSRDRRSEEMMGKHAGRRGWAR
jgi:hypothetical protein